MIRKSWAARLAAFAVLLGLMVQVTVGVPATIRMTQAVPICSAGHNATGEGVPDRLAHDHAHCLLCQAPAGPPLLAETPQIDPPAGYPAVPVQRVVARMFATGVVTGFLSRAPPFLA